MTNLYCLYAHICGTIHWSMISLQETTHPKENCLSFLAAIKCQCFPARDGALWDIFVKFSQGFKGGLQGLSCCLWYTVSNAGTQAKVQWWLSWPSSPSPNKVHFGRAIICHFLSKINPTIFPHSFIKVWDKWANMIRDRNSKKQGQCKQAA